jgi:CreA protein
LSWAEAGGIEIVAAAIGGRQTLTKPTVETKWRQLRGVDRPDQRKLFLRRDDRIRLREPRKGTFGKQIGLGYNGSHVRNMGSGALDLDPLLQADALGSVRSSPFARPGPSWITRSKPMPRLPHAMLVIVGLLSASGAARAEDLVCLSTTFRFLGPNDKVCVSAFDDPKVPGVACHVSQARTGGIKGGLGLAEDPSRFSIACRQIGPITTDISKLPDEESVYSEQTSIFFKHTHVFRIVDKKRNTLVYIALSDKIIEGSPQNSLSTVPVMPWGK